MKIKTHVLSYFKNLFLSNVLFGVTTIAVVYLCNSLAGALLGDHVPMSLFLAAAVAAARYGGVRAGIIATFLGALIEATFLINPAAFTLNSKHELARLFIYLMEGFIISLAIGEYHKAVDRIAISEKKLLKALENEKAAHEITKEAQVILIASQRKLEQLSKRAQDASKEKSLFLANMSHEIRNPLMGILGYTELLKEPGLSEQERAKYVSVIERTGQNLSDIINDILDLSKIEAGHLEAESVTFSVRNLINDIYLLLKIKCEEKGLTLQFEASPSVPEFINSDPTRLRQILMNLIGNAIKFTHQGFVRLHYRADSKNLYIKVQDSGIGITPDQRKNLFQNFGQGDCSIARKYAGTGLGLALSQQLAKLMGGNIELLESTPGVGSTFVAQTAYTQAYVKIPDTTDTDEIPVREPTLLGKSVLVVDDSKDNQLLMEHILTKQGCVIYSASNGKEALELVKTLDFDLILMDIQMPVMPGDTATKEIRAINNRTPIIALTAHAVTESREMCISAGCTEYVTKPIQTHALLKIMSKTLSSRDASLI